MTGAGGKLGCPNRQRFQIQPASDLKLQQPRILLALRENGIKESRPLNLRRLRSSRKGEKKVKFDPDAQFSKKVWVPILTQQAEFWEQGAEKTHNFFNINFLTPTPNPPVWAPRKSLCASFSWGKNAKRGPT